jgi:hypothetical protein
VEVTVNIPFVINSNICRSSDNHTTGNAEYPNEAESGVIQSDAHRNGDDSKDRNQEPEEGILRAYEEIILGEINRRFGR